MSKHNLNENNIKRRNFYLGNILKADINNIELVGDPKITSNVQPASVYDNALRYLLIKTNNHGKKLNYKMGDVQTNHRNPTMLVKNRTQNSNDGVILRCLEFYRHWNKYYHKPEDLPFENKKNCVIWRGATTGQPSRPVNRFTLVEKWFNKSKYIDVGFSNICQGKGIYRKYSKNKRIDKSEILKNKYIISVEGNDKDSGINWKLNSNSLVLMAKPRIESWLMETTLIPNYHYILLKDDFSDLEEKYLWCESNQDKCKEIIKNANTFMSQFKDRKNEEQLEIDVINAYFEILKNKKNKN